MAKVMFFGELEDKFGSGLPNMSVKSIPELVRAINTNIPGFSEHVRSEGNQYFVKVDDVAIAEKQLKDHPLGANATVSIVPVIRGAKEGGELAMIVLGAALIFMSGGIAAGIGGVFTSMSATTVTAIAGNVSMMGVSMIGMGLYSLLYTPEDSDIEEIKNKRFNGPVNTVSQGNPVPVGYGRLKIGSAVISSGLERDQGFSVAAGTIGGSEA